MAAISLSLKVVQPHLHLWVRTWGVRARISRIEANGSRTTVASELPSAMNSVPTRDTLGVAGVAFLGDQLYALIAGGGCSHGNPGFPNSVVRVNQRNGSVQIVADLSAFFAAHPVSHPEEDDFEPDGTPYSITVIDGQLIVIEANHGRILRVTPGGKIEQIADLSAPLGHIVPTSIAWLEDRYLVGMLGTFPIQAGTGRLYQVSKKGFVLDYSPGFTTTVAVQIDADGRIYILEFSHNDGFPEPFTGRVLRITRNVVDEVVTGLIVPTGMTIGPDGALYISDLGAAPAGAGRILRVVLP